MYKILITVAFTLIILSSIVSAVQSSEQVVVRSTAYNSAARTYTFSCSIPAGASTSRYWTIRPDTTNLEASFITTSSTINYTLSQNVLYHIGCQVYNGTDYIRGDFHIDRRVGAFTDKPNIQAIFAQGLQVSLKCTPPSGTTNYNLQWTRISASENTPLPEYNNKQNINLTLSKAGLWDFSCGVWDNAANKWSQWALPIEFFSSGAEAYIPNDSGCIPHAPTAVCNTSSGTTTNNTEINTPPQAPTWLEPSPNAVIDNYDFHIHVFPIVDAENDTHLATDFEIWDDSRNERVWSSLYNKVILTHIHNADGVFENSLKNKDRLLYNQTYRLRARFYTDTPTANISNWSEWRHFKTKPFLNFTNSPYLWTAREGYSVQLVTSNVSVPVNIAPAPLLYNHLPENERPLLYVTHLYGQIGMIRKDGKYVQYATNLLNYNSFGSIPGSGETGVIGLYVDGATGDLFVSMVYMDPTSGFMGKVVRFNTTDNGNTYSSNKTLLKNIPVAPSHQVQQITRGPDNKLYLNTGDDDQPFKAGDNNVLSGKILRFNEDGSIPSDNPYSGKYIYASGFRNIFGADWRDGTNELFVTSNGPDENDGVFKVLRGQTYGWCCSTASNNWHLWKSTVAPTAIVFNRGTGGFPASDSGTFYVATSGSTYAQGPSEGAKRIVQFRINSDGSKESAQDLVTYTGQGYGSPIGLAFADGGLYFTDIYGEAGFVGAGVTKGNIYRVVYNQTVNQTSNNNSVFSAALGTAAWYPQGRAVVWECKPSGGSGNYRYDYLFGDGQQQLNSPNNNVYHLYPSDGTYNALCTIRDQTTGKNASADAEVVLGVDPSGNNTGGAGGGSEGNINNTCFNSVEKIPASCIGGIVTSDTLNGCRTIICANGTSNLKIMACDKGSFFEMYKQSQAGSAVQKICIGETCIADNGFAKSKNFPICMSNQTATSTNNTNTGNSTNSTGSETTNISLDLKIAPWFPQGRSYVFQCIASGFTPSRYDYYFGNGEKALFSNRNDIYYTYPAAGSYVVQCIASNATASKTANLNISVV